ncbi:MAG TPA: peptidylprolyl isomerase [Verrucomicrobiae bacterium]|jgi:peptidyl-prolyl cis-trans isomerase C
MKAKKICFALALLSAVLSSPSFAADEFAIGPVLAKGKGLEIRRSQLDDAFVAFRANLAARGQNIPEAKREAAEAQLLDRMIITQLLVNKATAADKEHSKTNAVRFLAESRKMASSDQDFVRHLKSLGMTLAQFTNRVVEQAVSEEVINRELKSKITVSEEQMKKFWETNDAAFRQPEMARASHILFATKDLATEMPLSEADKKTKKAKAEAVLDRARKGEDFTMLATTFSEDPGTKENKGEYKFARAKDDARRAMVPEFEAVAFAMQTNQVSDIVTTGFGYHIIKLHEIIPARKVPFAEARERIQEFMLGAELEKQMPGFFAQVKKEADMEIVDEKLKAAMEKAEKERVTN